jgi:hypothetical protein
MIAQRQRDSFAGLKQRAASQVVEELPLQTFWQCFATKPTQRFASSCRRPLSGGAFGGIHPCPSSSAHTWTQGSLRVVSSDSPPTAHQELVRNLVYHFRDIHDHLTKEFSQMIVDHPVCRFDLPTALISESSLG